MVEPDSAEPIWRDIAVSVGAITASDASDNARFSVDFESAPSCGSTSCRSRLKRCRGWRKR